MRDLGELLRHAESSRVLNLYKVHADWQDRQEYKALPFFENKVLNRAIVMKYAVQPSDTYSYRKPKRRATKLIFPLDRNDLSIGGLFAFVGQKNLLPLLARHFSGRPLSERDQRVLQMLDHLPTFDPFLLYSLLKTNGIAVSEIYFQLSEQDCQAIQREMAGEFAPLIALCCPEADGDSGQVKQFIDKIINFNAGEALDTLRQSFGLTREDFAMAMFAWRGIIYYKWRSASLRTKLDDILCHMSSIRVTDHGGPLKVQMLELSRGKVLKMARIAGERVFSTIERYDTVYDQFVQDGEVEKFRVFLKTAPGLFVTCGQSVAILEHIMNFFETRTQRIRDGILTSFDFARLLAELELELGIDFQAKLRVW